MKAEDLKHGDKCVLVGATQPRTDGVILLVTDETSPFDNISKGVYTRRLTDGTRFQLGLSDEVIKVSL